VILTTPLPDCTPLSKTTPLGPKLLPPPPKPPVELVPPPPPSVVAKPSPGWPTVPPPEAARNRLNEATWHEAWEKGRSMTLDQAVSYALEGVRDRKIKQG
jgi:hypothetical protein